MLEKDIVAVFKNFILNASAPNADLILNEANCLAEPFVSLIASFKIDYVTKWQTDNDGTSDSNQITLPLLPTGNYDFIVKWGDGTQTTITTDSFLADNTIATHSYPAVGTYTVTMIGKFDKLSFHFNDDLIYGDALKLIDVSQWGINHWATMRRAFAGCSNLQMTATDNPDLSAVTDMHEMFVGADTFNGNIGGWNTENVTDMSGMFGNAFVFNQNIGKWNTSKVTNMSEMFQGAYVFNQNIGGWNTANVTDMRGMFSGANDFNQNIGGWNTANVTSMFGMFYGASTFNQNIGSWNTANVTTMNGMFYLAPVFNQNIGGWNTTKVTDMNYMFYGASAFNQNISGWNTANVTNMMAIFTSAYAFNQDLHLWNVSSVTNYTYYDYGASSWVSTNKPW